ncbi:uncharacterized protein IAS62_004249 [Cryptococcus decagattii]|uniref:Uncharacterized protein n=1 Tax=Cryptococcus decagattii TaxID=1859122 RepID=A0ABZ2B0C3_9TREE
MTFSVLVQVPVIDSRTVSLQQIYAEVDGNTKNLVDLSDTEVWDTLVTLVQVLRAGSDYLTDACLISKIAWYAEIIDPYYAASIQHALDKAIDQKTDFTTYRRAAESILGISATLSFDPLDDQMAENAHRDLCALIRQLELRIKSNKTATPVTTAVHSLVDSSTTTGASTSTPLTLHGSFVDTPILSPAVLSPFSSCPTSPGVNTPARPLPGLSSFNGTSTGIPAKPTPAPSSPAASVAGTNSSETWEYRGEASWEDVRVAWITIWVKEPKLSDLAEGEIPDSSPAGFQERDTGAWGNKIGWYGQHEEMYYEGHLKWELKDYE